MNSQPPNILVVDDTPANLQLLSDMLRSQGCKVRPVPSGEEALQASRRNPPDLILLDINMPGMTGYEVCQRLKEDPKLKDIPVLFISALSDTADKVKAFRAGGADYVTKPFQLEEVQARVETHLKLRHYQRELAEHNAQLEVKVRERTQELADAHARLASLDQAKSDFLTIISHELRTPLNGLFGVADLVLLESPAPAMLAEYRQLFEESRQRILTLVDDAVLLTQVRVTAQDLSAGTSSLESVLHLALEHASEASRAAGVALGRAPTAEGRVGGEAALLAKALQSLLLTTIKFSEPGGTVRLGLTPSAGVQQLTIETSGRAIPPAELPRFFDVLAIGKSITPGGDLGLGPAVAKCLITTFGGQVGVENLEPSGIRFSVRLRSSA